MASRYLIFKEFKQTSNTSNDKSKNVSLKTAQGRYRGIC